MEKSYVCKLAEGKVTFPSANLHKIFSRHKARHDNDDDDDNDNNGICQSYRKKILSN